MTVIVANHGRYECFQSLTKNELKYKVNSQKSISASLIDKYPEVGDRVYFERFFDSNIITIQN
jgi:hypothetical protein